MDEIDQSKDELSKSDNTDEGESSSSKLKRKHSDDSDTKTEYLTPRKSLRSRTITTKVKANNTGRGYPKAKSRRAAIKKNPTKYVPEKQKYEVENKISFEGNLYNIGDIVSFTDVDDGTYYAQIRYLFSASPCEKYCVINWLVPKSQTDPETDFVAANYILGYEENEMRDLRCCTHVSRCPSDYFKPLNAPYEVDYFPLVNSSNKTYFTD